MAKGRGAGGQRRPLLAETAAAPLPQMEARDVEPLGQGHTATQQGGGRELRLTWGGGGGNKSWGFRQVEMNRRLCT